jgi:hypothetical protein
MRIERSARAFFSGQGAMSAEKLIFSMECLAGDLQHKLLTWPAFSNRITFG